MKELGINPRVDKSVVRDFVRKFLPSTMPLTEDQVEFVIDQLPGDEHVVARNNRLLLEEAKQRGERERQEAQKRAEEEEVATKSWQRRTGKRRVRQMFEPIDKEVSGTQESYTQRNNRLFMVLHGVIPGPSEGDTQPVFLKKGK